MAKTVAEAAQERLASLIDRKLQSVWGTTATIAENEPLTSAKLKEMCDDWAKMIRNARRTQVRLQVALGHIGPVLKSNHPTDGAVIECSYHQAQAIHNEWPLLLDEVIDEHTAFFRPASGVGYEFTTKLLPPPPYEIPEV